MRIEKINDKQIRCMLNKNDLNEREIRISELAYGSEKAKALFRDMMQQASYEFGFEADDIPLMIEAIPMLPDNLIIIVTKVEDADELDTRFSQYTDNTDDELFEDVEQEEELGFDFSQSLIDAQSAYEAGASLYLDDEEEDDEQEPDNTTADEFKNTDFISLSEALGMEPRPKTKVEPKQEQDIIRIYQFQSLEELSNLSEHLRKKYHGENAIYKDKNQGDYYLLMHKSDQTSEEFNRICNTVSEYGKPIKNNYASVSYYEEHFDSLIAKNALQVLANL